MKFREDSRLKDKMEFHLETRHVFYIILWSIVLSGTIFFIGRFVGRKGMEDQGMVSAAENPLPKKERKGEDLQVDPLVSSFSFVSRLTPHPEKRELQDAVLNAMEKLRQETLERLEGDRQREERELAEKLFPRPKNLSPDKLLEETSGMEPKREEVKTRLGPVPDLSSVLAAAREVVPVAVVAEADPPEPTENEEEKPPVPALEVTKIEPDPAATADAAGVYFGIQAKAFREKGDAAEFLKYLQGELAKSKYRPFIMPVDLGAKGKWYRVRIGKFTSRLDAEKFKEQLEKKLGLETFLVSL